MKEGKNNICSPNQVGKNRQPQNPIENLQIAKKSKLQKAQKKQGGLQKSKLQTKFVDQRTNHKSHKRNLNLMPNQNQMLKLHTLRTNKKKTKRKLCTIKKTSR